jgi:GH15 family glucan-1,4-alpha-glucosidase
MSLRERLITRSLALLQAGQEPNGAFLACSTFPTYRYSWYRDSTFIAHALDLWGDHYAARRFYDWGAEVVLKHEDTVLASLRSPEHQQPARYLHTRYKVDGMPGDDEWPNFQLDGFGTFLWGMFQHLEMTGLQDIPPRWTRSARLLISYLKRLWRAPNYDCWEEFPDKIHLATLAALYGGLHAAGEHLGDEAAGATARAIQTFMLSHATNGILPKYLGCSSVDASLAWACVPFGALVPDDPIMIGTIERIERDLVGPHGGVHRYADDSYYGGGAWILLTAGLAECLISLGHIDRATELCVWIERQAGAHGHLPEQVPVDLHHPDMYEPWVERWGSIASPLLWSHAGYLRLVHRLRAAEQPDEAVS